MINTLKHMDIDDNIKFPFITSVCETSITITRGISTDLQLTGCIAELCMLQL